MIAHSLTTLRRLALLLVFATVTSATFAAETGIRFFEGTFKEAIAKAKAEKKPVFFDAYASWCGPCKAMDRDVYTDPKVAAYMNEKFISIKVDMEKGEGPELAKKLPSVDGYPSLLFFGPDGFLTKTLLGSRSAEDFLAEARLIGK